MAIFVPPLDLRAFEYKGERDVAEALSLALDDEWTVFHHLDWLPLEAESDRVEGETDFVLYHRYRGIVILEVKGGKISLSGGRWFYESQGKPPKPMTSHPYQQGRALKYELLPRLKDVHGAFYFIAFGAALPHHTWEDPYPTYASPATMLDKAKCTKETIADAIEELIVERRARCSPRHQNPVEEMSAEADKAVRRVLGEYTGNGVYSKKLRTLDRRIVTLSSAQSMARQVLRLVSPLYLEGGAGTGKTLLLRDYAEELSASGYKVLFLCFNAKLASVLSERFKSIPTAGGVDVWHFHRLLADWEQRNRKNRDMSANSSLLGDWLVEDALDLGEQYHAIFVDEAQDMRDEWFEGISSLAEEWDARLLVAYDQRQALYIDPPPDFLRRVSPLTLDLNIRNTAPIASLACKLGTMAPCSCFFQEGPVPTIRQYKNMVDQRRALLEVLSELRQLGFGPADVTLLSFRNLQDSVLEGNLSLGDFEFTEGAATHKAIRFATVHGFKGLESSVVILSDMNFELGSVTPVTVYVGATRARTALHILTTDASRVVLCREGDE